MNRLAALALACTAFLASAIAAAQAGPLLVKDAWMRQVPGADTAAVYLVLQNTGREPVIVTGARSSAAHHVMIHETTTVSGKTQMRHRDQLVIAPGERVEFKPGGLHLMLSGFTQQPSVGESVPLVLLLANGAEVQAAAVVRPLSAQ